MVFLRACWHHFSVLAFAVLCFTDWPCLCGPLGGLCGQQLFQYSLCMCLHMCLEFYFAQCSGRLCRSHVFSVSLPSSPYSFSFSTERVTGVWIGAGFGRQGSWLGCR